MFLEDTAGGIRFTFSENNVITRALGIALGNQFLKSIAEPRLESGYEIGNDSVSEALVEIALRPVVKRFRNWVLNR